jgi:hypothetical protein
MANDLYIPELAPKIIKDDPIQSIPENYSGKIKDMLERVRPTTPPTEVVDTPTQNDTGANLADKTKMTVGGITIAVVIIAVVLFFVLKRRRK